jgi:hypothetical protein
MTKMSDQFYIVTKAHEAIWPRGVLLFWGPDSNGYSTTLEHAGKYSREEALKICRLRPQMGKPLDFMIPCEAVDASAVRVVDLDKFKELMSHQQGQVPNE